MRRALCLVLACLVACAPARWLGADDDPSAPAAPPAAALTDLSADARELHAAFDAAAGRVRLVLIVSPG